MMSRISTSESNRCLDKLDVRLHSRSAALRGPGALSGTSLVQGEIAHLSPFSWAPLSFHCWCPSAGFTASPDAPRAPPRIGLARRPFDAPAFRLRPCAVAFRHSAHPPGSEREPGQADAKSPKREPLDTRRSLEAQGLGREPRKEARQACLCPLQAWAWSLLGPPMALTETHPGVSRRPRRPRTDACSSVYRRQGIRDR